MHDKFLVSKTNSEHCLQSDACNSLLLFGNRTLVNALVFDVCFKRSAVAPIQEYMRNVVDFAHIIARNDVRIETHFRPRFVLSDYFLMSVLVGKIILAGLFHREIFLPARMKNLPHL